MNAPLKLRTRKCKVCGNQYTPFKSFQKTCMDTNCLVEMGRIEARKRERKEDRKKRESLKTRSDYMKEAQIAFNAFIRLRDFGKPCICCGKPLGEDSPGGAYDCGHYRSVGSAPHLRFDERNANAQRKQCNRYGAGRAVDYRIGLIARLGVSAVEELESDQSVAKWTTQELIQIRDTYREKLKVLKKQRETSFDPSRECAYELNNENLKEKQ